MEYKESNEPNNSTVVVEDEEDEEIDEEQEENLKHIPLHFFHDCEDTYGNTCGVFVAYEQNPAVKPRSKAFFEGTIKSPEWGSLKVLYRITVKKTGEGNADPIDQEEKFFHDHENNGTGYNVEDLNEMTAEERESRIKELMTLHHADIQEIKAQRKACKKQGGVVFSSVGWSGMKQNSEVGKIATEIAKETVKLLRTPKTVSFMVSKYLQSEEWDWTEAEIQLPTSDVVHISKIIISFSRLPSCKKSGTIEMGATGDIRISSWLDKDVGSRDAYRSKLASEPIPFLPHEIIIAYDYPLGIPCEKTFTKTDSIWTTYDLVESICQGYKEIYEEEERTTPSEDQTINSHGIPLLNRVPTNGCHKITYHDIGDLVIERIFFNEDSNIISMFVGS